PAGLLDLADNDLIVNRGNFTAVEALVFAGFGQNTGITSSTSDGSQILALVDNALLHSAKWDGETVAANAIVGKYAYFGDSNLDGRVNADDYSILGLNLGTRPPPGIAWLRGDADLDGVVSPGDFAILDANFGTGAAAPLPLRREQDGLLD